MPFRNYKEIESTLAAYRKGVGQKSVEFKIVNIAKFAGEEMETIECLMKLNSKMLPKTHHLKVQDFNDIEQINQAIIREIERHNHEQENAHAARLHNR